MYSTVIAARVGDPRLVEAVASIARQTLVPERIEVITDAGQDVPKAWCREVLGASPSVHFHVQTDRGMAAAVAAGIRRVRSEYVAFLDCDDRWRPEKQERQIQELMRNPGLDAVTCRAANVHEGESVETGQGWPGVSSGMFTATTFRTRTFERFGLPDPEAGHYVWLYRWWARARSRGITTSDIDYVGLERGIHGENSWVTGNAEAHGALLAEIRSIVSARRAGTL